MILTMIVALSLAEKVEAARAITLDMAGTKIVNPEDLSVKRIYPNGQWHFKLGATGMWPLHADEYQEILRENRIEYPIHLEMEEQAEEIAPEPQQEEKECDRGSSRIDCEEVENGKCPIYQSDPNAWQVLSGNGQHYYTVRWNGSDHTCTCPDHKFRGGECKHIQALKRYKLRSRRSYSSPPGKQWVHTTGSSHSGRWIYKNDPCLTQKAIAKGKIRVLFEQDGEKHDLILEAGCTKEDAIASIPDGAKFIGTRRAA